MMAEARVPLGHMAANEFHYGMFVAYARGDLPDYLGGVGGR